MAYIRGSIYGCYTEQRWACARAVASSRPTPALKTKCKPAERTVRTRARTKAERVLSHGPCREARGWGGRARSSDEKTHAGAHKKQERAAVKVRVTRVCDDRPFGACRTGEAMGFVRKKDGHSGPTGRCVFGTWGRLKGARAKAQTWWLGGVGWSLSRPLPGPCPDELDDG